MFSWRIKKIVGAFEMILVEKKKNNKKNSFLLSFSRATYDHITFYKAFFQHLACWMKFSPDDLLKYFHIIPRKFVLKVYMNCLFSTQLA